MIFEKYLEKPLTFQKRGKNNLIVEKVIKIFKMVEKNREICKTVGKSRF